MSFTKVTDQDRMGKGNVGKPDTPDLSTSDMQALLDELPNMAIDAFNNHVDEIEANTAATYIGAIVPSDVTANENIQSIINALAFTLNLCNEAKHTHVNIETLNGITSSVKDAYDNLVTLFGNIESVQTTMTKSDAAVPTSKAVASYIDGVDISQKVFNEAYPIGSVYSTTSMVTPEGALGYGNWSQIGTADANNVKRYVRVS